MFSAYEVRDPIIYRIIDHYHYRQKNKYKVFPTYDWAHPLEDAIEGITHSFCTIEFAVHRPLYDWILLNAYKLNCFSYKTIPKQIEFSRLNLEYTLLSKRKLTYLVDNGYVNGWDDPLMPTISGLRRRGWTPKSINSFIDRVGFTKSISSNNWELFESCLQSELNLTAYRRMVVIDPIKLTITNWKEDHIEWLDGTFCACYFL